MNAQTKMKTPKNLSPRIEWLRNYYFEGVKRDWNNQYNCYTTGQPWDELFNELTYYIVPETIAFYQTFTSSTKLSAQPIPLPNHFWNLSRKERRAFFLKEAIVNHPPIEILPHNLICGAGFTMMTSQCLNETEASKRHTAIHAKNGARSKLIEYYRYGFGNAGATSGHLIPGYEKILQHGFTKVYDDLNERYLKLMPDEQESKVGEQIRAMMIASLMPMELAKKYEEKCLFTRLVVNY